MDEFNKRGLTNEQQRIIDIFHQWFESYDDSPVDSVAIVCNDILARIFLMPEEIEEIELERKESLIPLNILRNLTRFSKDFWDEIRRLDLKLEEVSVQTELKIVLGDENIPEILELFGRVNTIIIKQNLRNYIIYFLAIEKWYKEQTWDELSFKWLEVPVGYDEWLWF